MKIKTALFEISATSLKGCPKRVLPEIAVIGRSNVGKSSLVNMLTEKKDLAKASGTPGKTRLLNFFRINEAWFFVDLPGYGYAKLSKSKSFDFGESVANYLQNREQLLCTCVLIDSMIPPQEIDLQFLRWLDQCGLRYVVIFTKTDRQSPTATRKAIEAFEATLDELGLNVPDILSCSAKAGTGRLDVLKYFDALLHPKPTKAAKTSKSEDPEPGQI
jgi:GTP-binding protein